MHNFADRSQEYLTSLLLKKYHYIVGTKFKKDTTNEQIVEQIVNYYQDIISCMPGNVYWLDKEGKAVGCNQNVLNMFGLKSIDEFKGLTFEDMCRVGNWTEEATQSFKKDTLDVIYSGKPVLNVEEPPIPHANGTVIHFLTSRVPLFDHTGTCVGVVGISIDITERKEIELLLKIAKENAEQANKAKSVFLANMSHDIKTPLTGMICSAELLSHSIDNPELKSRADDIVQSGLSLLDFMNQLLRVSRSEITEDAASESRFKLKNLINDIVVLIKPTISNKNLDFILSYDEKIPVFLIGNRWYLHRILLNLLSNATKFTHKGRIKLDVKLVKKASKQVIIQMDVSDTGIGIPRDKQFVIFDQFVRLSPSHEGIYPGSGLGLSIVKQFVKSVEGEVYVESELGQGSTFTIIVPLKKSLIQDEAISEQVDDMSLEQSSIISQQLSAVSTNEPVKKSPSKKNAIQVLLVEDNKIVAKNMRDTLVTLGCQVDIAYNGNEALSLFDNEKYQIIYMDLGLPDMSGVDVTQKIRQLERSANSRSVIFALSAHVDKELQEHCRSVGMNDVFPKPLLFDMARKTIALARETAKN